MKFSIENFFSECDQILNEQPNLCAMTLDVNTLT